MFQVSELNPKTGKIIDTRTSCVDLQSAFCEYRAILDRSPGLPLGILDDTEGFFVIQKNTYADIASYVERFACWLCGQWDLDIDVYTKNTKSTYYQNAYNGHLPKMVFGMKSVMYGVHNGHFSWKVVERCIPPRYKKCRGKTSAYLVVLHEFGHALDTDWRRGQPLHGSEFICCFLNLIDLVPFEETLAI